MSDRVVARAFRGTRRRSVYRDHEIGSEDLGRIAEAARQSDLEAVASLAAVPRELDKETAGALAAELTELRRGAALLDLDDDFTALAEVARFCSRAQGGAWLTLS